MSNKTGSLIVPLQVKKSQANQFVAEAKAAGVVYVEHSVLKSTVEISFAVPTNARKEFLKVLKKYSFSEAAVRENYPTLFEKKKEGDDEEDDEKDKDGDEEDDKKEGAKAWSDENFGEEDPEYDPLEKGDADADPSPDHGPSPATPAEGGVTVEGNNLMMIWPQTQRIPGTNIVIKKGEKVRVIPAKRK